MKIYFLLILLFFQAFFHNSLSAALTSTAKTVFNVIDNSLNCLERIEEATPLPAKIAGNLYISYQAHKGTMRKYPILNFFLMSPYKIIYDKLITNYIIPPIMIHIVKTNFFKIQQELYILQEYKTMTPIERAVNKNPPKKLKKKLKKKFEQRVTAYIGIFIFFVSYSPLRDTWHNLKYIISHIVPKKTSQKLSKIITIIENMISSRICFFPLILHKHKIFASIS